MTGSFWGGKRLFEQLNEVTGRLEEITRQLSEPETARDPARLQELMKERASLTPVAETVYCGGSEPTWKIRV